MLRLTDRMLRPSRKTKRRIFAALSINITRSFSALKCADVNKTGGSILNANYPPKWVNFACLFTHREHMPPNHRFRADWTPERIRRQAAQIGSNAEAYVEVVMRERKHPEQGYRTCLGVLRLAKTFGRGRLEAACGRAVEINARSYSSLHSILKNGLDRKPRTRATDEPAITHPNIRGAEYFH